MFTSSTNASAKSLTPLANSTFNDCVTQSGPLTVDASFQFVDVWDLGMIDSLLKHTPHGVVNRVQVQWVRRPDFGWDEIGHLLIQQRYCLWCGAMAHCPVEKRKIRSQMLHECPEAASVSKRRHDNTLVRPIDFDPVSSTWMLLAPRLDTATETITDLAKFDLVLADESHWRLSF